MKSPELTPHMRCIWKINLTTSLIIIMIKKAHSLNHKALPLSMFVQLFDMSFILVHCMHIFNVTMAIVMSNKSPNTHDRFGSIKTIIEGKPENVPPILCFCPSVCPKAY
jgi:hypothetical protein